MKQKATVRSCRSGVNNTVEDLAPIERELAFCKGVCSGNLETVKTLFAPLGDDGFGKLCEDRLKDLKYHLVVTIALLTRYCSSSGMSKDEAQALSDGGTAAVCIGGHVIQSLTVILILQLAECRQCAVHVVIDDGVAVGFCIERTPSAAE